MDAKAGVVLTVLQAIGRRPSKSSQIDTAENG